MMRESLLSSMHPAMKLLSLIVLVIVSFLVVFLFGFLVSVLIWGKDVLDNLVITSDSTGSSQIGLLKYYQVVNQLGIFVVPAVAYALLQGQSVGRYMLMDRLPDRQLWILSVVLIFAVLPFVNWLMEVNGRIYFPESLEGLENWFKGREEEAMRMTEIFLNTTSFSGYLVNVLMIAVLAAVGEEFLFRGVLLRLFHEWSGSVHVAVILSAFLFSALHFQFYGVIPRMALGVVLGYSYVWAGTLWIPLFIHFLNNLLAVTVAYLSNLGHINTDFESFGATGNEFVIVASLAVTVAVMLMMRRRRWSSEE